MSFPFNLDIEPTNRCNAKCNFCPRDQTPHQGLMTPEVFDQALARAVEFREVLEDAWNQSMKVNLCGLGEPLLNRHTGEFVGQIVDAGFECSISTNASLLDEARATEVLEAGLNGAAINVGDLDEEYDEVYRLPFEKTLDNVLRFKQMVGPDFDLQIVVVDHRGDPDHMQRVFEFWRGHEINRFMPYSIINRGGALSVDHMQYETYAESAQAQEMLHSRDTRPMCVVPFQLPFIGYDGQYYLCCSDWKKEAPLGSVFDKSFVELTRDRLRHVMTREPVCKSCNLDPANMLVDKLRARAAGEVLDEDVDVTLAKMLDNMHAVQETLEVLDPGAVAAVSAEVPVNRKLIPLRVL